MKALLFLLLFSGSAVFAQQPGGVPITAAPIFTSIENVSAVVPATVNIKVDGQWSVIGIDQASQAVEAKAKNQAATFHLKVLGLEPFKGGGWSYRVQAPDGDLTIHGAKIFYRVFAYFRADQADALAKVHKGSMITVTGILGRADIKMYPDHGRPGLCMDLMDAKIER